MTAIRATRFRAWAAWGLVGLGGTGGGALLAVWRPPTDPRLSVCVSRRVLGVSCPGCGLTRGMSHLVRGEWAAAAADHPLAPAFAAEALLAWAAWGAGLARRREPPFPPRWIVPLLAGNALLLLAVWLARLLGNSLPV